MNFHIGDHVIICNESTPYFLEKGTIQFIDIYGHVNIKIYGRNETNIKVKREEIRPYFNTHNSFYLNNPGFTKYIQNKYRDKLNPGNYDGLGQVIDLSLDTKDKEWFTTLTNQYIKRSNFC